MVHDNPTARPVANARDSHSPSVTSGTSLAPSSPAESATSPSNSAASSAPEAAPGQREGVADQPGSTETSDGSLRIAYTPNGLPIAPWRLSHQEMVALQVLTRSHREGPLAFYQPYPPGVDPEYLHARIYKGHGAPNGPP